jgi:reverse gyrase
VRILALLLIYREIPAYSWIKRCNACEIMLLDVLEICCLMKCRQVPVEVSQPLVDKQKPRSNGL